MSNIIELSPDRPAADADKIHAEAFRNLEGDVCDLDRMGEIAFDLIQQCSTHGDESSQHAFELAAFAVSQFASMANAFRENYYAAHSGEEWPQ